MTQIEDVQDQIAALEATLTGTASVVDSGLPTLALKRSEPAGILNKAVLRSRPRTPSDKYDARVLETS